MTQEQKDICKELLRRHYSEGFDTSFSLREIGNSFHLSSSDLYDTESCSGILWELGEFGEGLISVSSGGAVSINFDMKDLVEAWTR